jgi:hypothetical protein
MRRDDYEPLVRRESNKLRDFSDEWETRPPLSSANEAVRMRVAWLAEKKGLTVEALAAAGCRYRLDRGRTGAIWLCWPLRNSYGPAGFVCAIKERPLDPERKQRFVPGSSASQALPLRFGKLSGATRCYLVEGETDAVWLSLRDPEALVLGLPQGAGSQGLWKEHWTELIPERVSEVWVAYDPDPAGETSATSALMAIPGSRRLVPPAKDWCELPGDSAALKTLREKQRQVLVVSARSKCTVREESREGAGKERKASEPLASLYIEPPYTSERLLRSEGAVSLAGIFLADVRRAYHFQPHNVFMSERTGEGMAFAPKMATCPNGVWTLGEILHWETSGDLRVLTKSERAIWLQRLWIELGLLDPVPASEESSYLGRWRIQREAWSMTSSAWKQQRVFIGFLFLASIHWLRFPGRPVAFSCEWAAGWCAVGVTTAQKALRCLEQGGFLHKAGIIGRCNAFLPGRTKTNCRTESDSQCPKRPRARGESAAPARGYPPDSMEVRGTP